MSANILCIESSFQFCSVAIGTAEGIIETESGLVQNHAESLMVLIQDCLEKANLKINDLHAVAISSGPGSYTGLRIGTSTAKGICYALNIPLISIDTLYSIARAAISTVEPNGSYIWPMIDARRMEVYHCLYDANLKPLTEVKNGIIGEVDFVPNILSTDVILCGDGAEKAVAQLGYKLVNVKQHAKHMCKTAEEKFTNMDFEDLEKFEPFYLKFANITVSNKQP